MPIPNRNLTMAAPAAIHREGSLRAVRLGVWVAGTALCGGMLIGAIRGHVLPLEQWKKIFDLSDRYGFVIASDECYSEIYFDEARAPLGALGAARALGRDGFPRLVVFGSLSKRSNAPGLRSGVRSRHHRS